ncbi:type III-B CRISPR module RAMP protein Cmr6 [Allorhodopirellula heiligendammensis]|uniref:CRISPR type III-associated protein domain-containing protein n=1 Tax=Allorhodopirellula heiligendammensis TaxID=2714739 RepID=A0A5C6C366_9BACT|nr:type III-B CRISPR module RAMP protein Cmr6 [Allorhodopirellula heiligendammensis]TWU17956.1 hypothetical protein Poly21_01080 [Allorhodopirellula heiligendammensis]
MNSLMQEKSGTPSYHSPLPRDLAEAAPWKHDTNGNLGLIFDKCGDAWTWDTTTGKVLVFNPPKDERAGKNRDWLDEFVAMANQRAGRSDGQLQNACDRQRRMIQQLGGGICYVRNESRFVTGMGRQHPLENGFSWHPTLGTPYLAGSGLKGMFRAWLRECGLGDQDSRIIQRCGGRGQIGELVFFDMLPLQRVRVVKEIMTPHYGDYYRKPSPGESRKPPGDWQSPNPISFLAVEADQPWQFGIAVRPMCDDNGVLLRSRERRERLGELIDKPVVGSESLLDGLDWVGLGAKTNIGMGCFTVDSEIERKIEVEEETARRQRDAAIEEARKAAEFTESLASASPQLQALMKQQRAESWTRAADDQKMTQGILDFAKSNPDPPQDCLDWIRDFIESIPNYKGVWTNANAMQGKRNDKPKYGSPKGSKVRDIVNQLNPELES